MDISKLVLEDFVRAMAVLCFFLRFYFCCNGSNLCSCMIPTNPKLLSVAFLRSESGRSVRPSVTDSSIDVLGMLELFNRFQSWPTIS